jgi:hypothetical protein
MWSYVGLSGLQAFMVIISSLFFMPKDMFYTQTPKPSKPASNETNENTINSSVKISQKESSLKSRLKKATGKSLTKDQISSLSMTSNRVDSDRRESLARTVSTESQSPGIAETKNLPDPRRRRNSLYDMSEISVHRPHPTFGCLSITEEGSSSTSSFNASGSKRGPKNTTPTTATSSLSTTSPAISKQSQQSSETVELEGAKKTAQMNGGVFFAFGDTYSGNGNHGETDDAGSVDCLDHSDDDSSFDELDEDDDDDISDTFSQLDDVLLDDGASNSNATSQSATQQSKDSPLEWNRSDLSNLRLQNIEEQNISGFGDQQGLRNFSPARRIVTTDPRHFHASTGFLAQSPRGFPGQRLLPTNLHGPYTASGVMSPAPMAYSLRPFYHSQGWNAMDPYTDDRYPILSHIHSPAHPHPVLIPSGLINEGFEDSDTAKDRNLPSFNPFPDAENDKKGCQVKTLRVRGKFISVIQIPPPGPSQTIANVHFGQSPLMQNKNRAFPNHTTSVMPQPSLVHQEINQKSTGQKERGSKARVKRKSSRTRKVSGGRLERKLKARQSSVTVKSDDGKVLFPCKHFF